MIGIGTSKKVNHITDSTPRDWQAFERKLALGHGFSQAALEAGIPEEEALTYATERLKKPNGTALELKAISEEAFKVSLEILIKIAKEEPRYSVSNSGGLSSTPVNTDLDAAKSLAKLALDAMKIFRNYEAQAAPAQRLGVVGTLDLFDLRGPWDLRDTTEN